MISFEQIDTGSTWYQAERELRNSQLLRPIGIPDYGWEMHDEDSFHFVALKGKDVVGCAMLYPPASSPGVLQLMQMAVIESLRGRGIGRGLAGYMIEFAEAEGFREVVCHSRDSAVGFYENLGFSCFGEPFTEVGILHRHMKYKIIQPGGNHG